nr:hypothetical protein [Pontibacter russatus]
MASIPATHFSRRWSLSNWEKRNWMFCCSLPEAVIVSTGWVTATTAMPSCESWSVM